MTSYFYVSPKASVGKNVKIGRFVVVEDDVTIGDDVVLEEFALVQTGATIGKGTKVGTYTKVGKRAVVGDHCSFTSYCEIRDDCILGNEVLMGSRCTLSAGTRVGDNVIMKYGFVVTDTPVLLNNSVKNVGGLGSRSRFGANVTIMPGVTIGENSEIGACSQVRSDVPAGEVWYGSPAKFYRLA
jgi:UDP-2-acetamido-3-amino-2,3-dideoxy-glucuronate N-acetyltransferase